MEFTFFQFFIGNFLVVFKLILTQEAPLKIDHF